jgi:hypothetical protein
MVCLHISSKINQKLNRERPLARNLIPNRMVIYTRNCLVRRPLQLFFECGIPRPQDVGHLLCNCFDFKVRLGTPGLTNNLGLHRQSSLKSPQTTCYCNFFIQLYSAIAVLATCPWTQGCRKEPLFHTRHRSVRDRESNPGQLLGRQHC